MAQPLRIGLTGGIGSGKSTVASILVRLGAALIDTDAIARSMTGPGGAAIPDLGAAFGPEFIAPDGALDRTRMRTAAFADESVRRRLEAILHPRIGNQVESLAAATMAPVVVLDIPLLVESGRWRARVDQVWLVDCAESLQIERVMHRSGWTADAVQAVIDQQASRSARRNAADAVIHNEDISRDELAGDVESLWLDAIAPRQ